MGCTVTKAYDFIPCKFWLIDLISRVHQDSGRMKWRMLRDKKKWQKACSFLKTISFEGKPCVEATQGKQRDILNDPQRLLSALMVHEGDSQTHMNWPRQSLGLLRFLHFRQSSYFIHCGSYFQTCPAPLLLEIIPGPWSSRSDWHRRGGICPTCT